MNGNPTLGSRLRARVAAGGSILALLLAPLAVSADDTGLYAASIGRTQSGALMVHYWAKGKRLRSETIVVGRPIVTIVNGEHYYTLDLLLGEGVAIRRSSEAVAADAKRRRAFGIEYDEIVAAGGEKIGSESIGSREVDVYRITDDSGRRTLWVSADAQRVPMRIETYDRASGRTGRVDYVDWLTGLELPDAFFEPPQGVKLERFESYEAYLAKLSEGPVGSLPPVFPDLLRGASR